MNVNKQSVRLDIPNCFPADQVDIHLLRCQQLRLYILKAGRALLCHQDKLRQILSQPAVADIGPSPTGETQYILIDHKYFFGLEFGFMLGVVSCFLK